MLLAITNFTLSSVRRHVAVAFCQGHRPSISTSSEKLRKVRISTIPARMIKLWTVGFIATVLMMSAATRNSRPRRIDLPSPDRKSDTSLSRGADRRIIRKRKTASVPNAPMTMIAVPTNSTALVARWIQYDSDENMDFRLRTKAASSSWQLSPLPKSNGCPASYRLSRAA